MAGHTALTTDNPSTADAEALADALGAQSAVALQELRKGVLMLLNKELRDSALAEDLCNETFRVVIERLREQPLRDPSRLSFYLAMTARNLAIANRQKMKRRRTDTGNQRAIDNLSDPDDDPSAILERQTRAAAVRKVLEEIRPIRDREILVRVYLHDQDREEVCRALGIDESHFKRVIYNARERFRNLMERRFRVSDLYCLVIA